jgi:hypothetical protein
MKRLTALAGLLICVACSDSAPSGELSYEYVYNPMEQEFRKNTLHGGQLTSSETITAEEYDRDSGAGLTAEQIRGASEAPACSFAPGDYLIEYSVVTDPCGMGPLPTELVTMGSASFVGVQTTASSGCMDEWTAEGCSASLYRQCEVFVRGEPLSLDLSVTIDTVSKVGTATIRSVPGDSVWGAFDATCSSSQSVTLEELN